MSNNSEIHQIVTSKLHHTEFDEMTKYQIFDTTNELGETVVTSLS